MSMRDQYGNELLDPGQREIHADKHIWGVYEVPRGCHYGTSVMSCMTLPDAKEEARKRNEKIGTGAEYSFNVYRPYDKTKRRTPQKPGPRKR